MKPSWFIMNYWETLEIHPKFWHDISQHSPWICLWKGQRCIWLWVRHSCKISGTHKKQCDLLFGNRWVLHKVLTQKNLYYHHPWPFKVTHMCISVNLQVVSKKKKAKGIAEQVRGQNLSGLVLVLFLPKPMEGVIVWHFETLICSIYFCACFSSSFLNLEVLMDFQEPVPRGGSWGLAHIAAHIHHIEFSRI